MRFPDVALLVAASLAVPGLAFEQFAERNLDAMLKAREILDGRWTFPSAEPAN